MVTRFEIGDVSKSALVTRKS